MASIKDLWHARSQQASHAASAESAGFPGTAAKARAEVERLEREIKAAQAAEEPGPWTSEAHP